MHFVHLTNPYGQNFLSILFSLVSALFPVGPICKYWTPFNEDTASLKQIEQMRKCPLS